MYRSRFGSEALDASEILAEGLALRAAQAEAAVQVALEARVEARPILTVVVCLSCGSFEVVRMSRAWAIDRAMRRSGLCERDVRAALALLIEAGGDGDLDALDGERLRELHGLVGEDVDFESVRARYANG